MSDENSPIPPRSPQGALPGGFSLEEGERILRTGKDWGLDDGQLALTTRRVISTADPSRRALVAVALGDIAEVAIRKPRLGYATVTVRTRDGRMAAFAAHINGPRIREDILMMAGYAQRA